jgi:hypothetical protein
MGRKYTVDDLGAKPKRINRLVNGTSPRVIKRRQRLADALNFRLQGHSYYAIGRHMHCSPSRAQDLVIEALANLAPPDTQKQVWDIEMHRLDAMQAAIQGAASDGDIPAIKACLEIMHHRDRLCGLFPDSHGSGGNNLININVGNKANDEANCLRVVFVKPDPDKLVDVTPPRPLALAALPASKPHDDHPRGNDHHVPPEPDNPAPGPERPKDNVVDGLGHPKMSAPIAQHRFGPKRGYPDMMDGGAWLNGSCDKPEPRKKSE